MPSTFLELLERSFSELTIDGGTLSPRWKRARDAELGSGVVLARSIAREIKRALKYTQ